MRQPDPGITLSVEATPTSTVEHNFNQRFKEHKSTQKNEAETAVTYFDETETPTITLPIANHPMDIMIKTAIAKIGPPHNYGHTPQQKADISRVEKQKKLEEATVKQEEEAAMEQKEIMDRQGRCNEWSAQMDEIRRENYDRILEGAPPMREYLAKHLLPAVQKGLMAVVQCRPADPIDFLGEFFIQLANPLTHDPTLPVDEQLIKVARK